LRAEQRCARRMTRASGSPLRALRQFALFAGGLLPGVTAIDGVRCTWEPGQADPRLVHPHGPSWARWRRKGSCQCATPCETTRAGHWVAWWQWRRRDAARLLARGAPRRRRAPGRHRRRGPLAVPLPRAGRCRPGRGLRRTSPRSAWRCRTRASALRQRTRPACSPTSGNRTKAVPRPTRAPAWTWRWFGGWLELPAPVLALNLHREALGQIATRMAQA